MKTLGQNTPLLPPLAVKPTHQNHGRTNNQKGKETDNFKNLAQLNLKTSCP